MNEILKTITNLRCFLRVKQEDWAFIESSLFIKEIITLIKKQLQIWESLLQIDGINSKGEVLKDLKKIIEEIEKVEKTI
jgi:two-component sensor histidine kinase